LLAVGGTIAIGNPTSGDIVVDVVIDGVIGED